MIYQYIMLCKCGCGEETKIASKTRSECGWIKGQPKNYINGHNGRLPIGQPRLCNCGCGSTTTVSKITDPKRGYVCGQYHTYISGHDSRTKSFTHPKMNCQCGCGELTEIAECTSYKLNWVKGHPKPFLRGHKSKKIKLGTTHIMCRKCNLNKSVGDFNFCNITYCKACLSRTQKINRIQDPVKIRACEHNSRVKRAQAKGYCSASQLKARIDYYGGLCAYCKEPYKHIDHVIPLSRGGTNWPANLRPACSHCNLSKSNLPLSKWLFKLNKTKSTVS